MLVFWLAVLKRLSSQSAADKRWQHLIPTVRELRQAALILNTHAIIWAFFSTRHQVHQLMNWQSGALQASRVLRKYDLVPFCNLGSTQQGKRDFSLKTAKVREGGKGQANPLKTKQTMDLEVLKLIFHILTKTVKLPKWWWWQFVLVKGDQCLDKSYKKN